MFFFSNIKLLVIFTALRGDFLCFMPKGMQSSQSVAELFQHSRKPFKTTFSLDTRAFGNPLSVQLSVGNKRCNRLNVDHDIRNGFLLQENSSEIRTGE